MYPGELCRYARFLEVFFALGPPLGSSLQSSFALYIVVGGCSFVASSVLRNHASESSLGQLAVQKGIAFGPFGSGDIGKRSVSTLVRDQ